MLAQQGGAAPLMGPGGGEAVKLLLQLALDKQPVSEGGSWWEAVREEGSRGVRGTTLPLLGTDRPTGL